MQHLRSHLDPKQGQTPCYTWKPGVAIAKVEISSESHLRRMSDIRKSEPPSTQWRINKNERPFLQVVQLQLMLVERQILTGKLILGHYLILDNSLKNRIL